MCIHIHTYIVCIHTESYIHVHTYINVHACRPYSDQSFCSHIADDATYLLVDISSSLHSREAASFATPQRVNGRATKPWNWTRSNGEGSLSDCEEEGVCAVFDCSSACCSTSMEPSRGS